MENKQSTAKKAGKQSIIRKDDKRFTVEGPDGVMRECEVLFTFDNGETGAHYMVFTDGTRDANGDTMVFANIVSPDDVLLPIETEQEWKLIETTLRVLQEQIKKAQGE